MIDFKAAAASLTFAREAFKYTLDQKVDEKVKDKVGEALDKIGKVQDDLFTVREDLLELQEDNRKLKDELRDKETWENITSKYELIKTPAKAMIYRFKGEPEHFACPVCMVEKNIYILQEYTAGSFRCQKCKNCYDYVDLPEEPPASGSGRSWVTGY
jgi:predicted nuclease with TOPRIM domain